MSKVQELKAHGPATLANMFLFASAMALLCYILVSFWREYAPSSMWYVVHSVQISDAAAGEDPQLFYDRTIKRKFFGKWTVTLHRVEDDSLVGGALCQGTGAADYKKSARQINDVTLFNWFMELKEVCILPPGQYYALTLWRIFPINYPEKRRRIRSNNFEIYAK